MRIVVSGGTGFLGQALVAALRANGHSVMVLTRRPGREGDLLWSPDVTAGSWTAAVHAADVIINLAGEGIADRRWSAARKKAILHSRVTATRALADTLREAARPAAVFLSGSAIGMYGDRGDEVVTEQTPPGSDFLARVCIEWEREACAAADVTRVVLLRTGIVLAREEAPCRGWRCHSVCFAGGPIGSGRQYLSWVHRDDWVAMVMWAMNRPTLVGPVNITAPEPVRNGDFARLLGRVLHRPSFVPTPAFALRLALGELADTALLSSLRVLPAAAMAEGFEFRYPQLEGALRAIYSSDQPG